ncbi:MAG TPA: glycosyltransferase [Gemmatimonadota bacterium]|jgi:glycosyltransferase involved in cell wall biosynthesis
MTGPEVEPGLVSTIVPVHDRPVLLEEAVESVLGQSYRPLEVVIVDDGSTDETPRVADRLAAENPATVRALHVARGGPGRAREAGRRAARGEFLQYLDSDDLLVAGKFESQIAALRTDTAAGVAYGWTAYRPDGRSVGDRPWKRTGERIERMFPSFLQSRWWGTSTPLYRRSVTDAAGPWSDLWNEEDWEYDCRVAALGVRLAFVPRLVSIQRGHDGTRLSRAVSSDPEKLRNRALAHARILGHARRAGIGPRAAEMRHFARELFLLARQCGAAGLARESRELARLSRLASRGGGRGLDVWLYSGLAGVVGWRRLGRLAGGLDRLR